MRGGEGDGMWITYHLTFHTPEERKGSARLFPAATNSFSSPDSLLSITQWMIRTSPIVGIKRCKAIQESWHDPRKHSLSETNTHPHNENLD